MKWFCIEERLPEVDELTGESEYVFVYRGNRSLPQVAKFSNGLYCKKGWWLASDIGSYFPLYAGRGKNKRPSYWAEIELPNEKFR